MFLSLSSLALAFCVGFSDFLVPLVRRLSARFLPSHRVPTHRHSSPRRTRPLTTRHEICEFGAAKCDHEAKAFGRAQYHRAGTAGQRSGNGRDGCADRRRLDRITYQRLSNVQWRSHSGSVRCRVNAVVAFADRSLARLFIIILLIIDMLFHIRAARDQRRRIRAVAASR